MAFWRNAGLLTCPQSFNASSSTGRRAGSTEQAFDAEAAFGAAGIAPEGNDHGPVQPALVPVDPAPQAFFPLRNCRSSFRRVKNSTSFWRGNGQELMLPDCVGAGVGLGL